MARYRGYYISGRRGTVHQLLINGEAYMYDSVSGDELHRGDGQAIARFERSLGDAISYEAEPLFPFKDADEIKKYVGA